MAQTYVETVFNVTIRCSRRKQQICFRVPSDMEWWSFRTKVCKRMGINPATARLSYRQFYDILYGSLCRLRGGADWAEAILKLGKANDEDAPTELEIIDVSRPTAVRVDLVKHVKRILTDLSLQTTSRSTKKPMIRSAASAHLSDQGLNIETYYFSYPKVADLLKLVDNEVDGFVAGWSYKGISLSDMLGSVGMVNVDDFVMTSLLVLHTSCGIPIRAVELLYIGAEKMIRMVHKEMAHKIKDLWEHREAYEQVFSDRLDSESSDVV